MSLESKALHTGFTPPGGWYYVQEYRDEQHKIKRTTADELVSAVRQFRAQNHIDEHRDVEADIAEFTIERNPPSCNGRTPEPRRDSRSGIEPISAWLESLSMSAPDRVIESDATDRAKICAKCPMNVEWRIGKADPRDIRTQARAVSIRGAVKFALDYRLAACSLHGIHLGCAVFLDQANLPSKKENAPQNCWLK